MKARPRAALVLKIVIPALAVMVPVAAFATETSLAAKAPTATETARMHEFLDSRYTKSDVRHSFKTKFGEVIDCIDFFAQPGVKALMARGIPITTAVPPSPEGSTSSSVLSDDAFNGQPDADGLPRSCPQGSVPILRLTVDDIQAHGALDRFMQDYAHKVPPPTDSRSLTQPETGLPDYAHVTIASSTSGNITGMQDYLNILAPVILSPGYSHSISQIWIGQWGATSPPGGPACTSNCEQTIEVGWNVDKQVNSDAKPHLFTFATSNGYGNGCYNNVNGIGGTCITSSWIASGATYTPGMVLTPGAQTELHVFVKYDPYASPPSWWAWVNGQYFEAWPSSDFSAIPGTTMATAANFVLAGGEVEDLTDTFAVQMGSGSAANATSVDGFGGVGTTGYHHDLEACAGLEGNTPPCTGSYKLTGAPTPTMPAFYSFSQTGGQSSWNNYFFYGDAPGAFWGLNYGFQRQNWLGEGDWAINSYKGECGLGQPVTGLSKYGGAPARAVLCGTTTISNYSQASCHGLSFYPSDNRSGVTDSPGLGDWDRNYVKGECAANEYVQGVAQNTSGLLSTLYCCQGSVGHKSCDVQIFYSSNSPGYGSNPDWDPYYYKGQCPAGQYVAGVSAVYFASNGTPGAPHALLCCTP